MPRYNLMSIPHTVNHSKPILGLFLFPKYPALSENKYGEETYIVSSVPPPVAPECSVSPPQGSALTSFSISCHTSCLLDQCPPDDSSSFTYCFYLEPSKIQWLDCYPESSSLTKGLWWNVVWIPSRDGLHSRWAKDSQV